MRKIYSGKYIDFKKEHEIEIIQSGVTCVVLDECGDKLTVLKLKAERAQGLIRELKAWRKVCDWCEANEWRRPDEAKVHLDPEHGGNLAAKLKQLLERMAAEAKRRDEKEEVKKLERLAKWVEANC